MKSKLFYKEALQVNFSLRGGGQGGSGGDGDGNDNGGSGK